jgi:hypothetical protein
MLKPLRFHKDEPLAAKPLNQIAAEVSRLGKVTVSPPLTLIDDEGGLHFGVISGGVDVRYGVVTQQILPRSGSTLGKGKVRLYDADPDTGAATDTGVDIDVWNETTTTGPVGRWGKFVQLSNGSWSPVDISCS